MMKIINNKAANIVLTGKPNSSPEGRAVIKVPKKRKNPSLTL
ncbi:hypothetical protein [Desulfurobacterium sp.]